MCLATYSVHLILIIYTGLILLPEFKTKPLGLVGIFAQPRQIGQMRRYICICICISRRQNTDRTFVSLWDDRGNFNEIFWRAPSTFLDRPHIKV